MVVIRMSRNGSKNRPFYKIIVIDKRYSGEGKSIEKIGFFDPINKQNNIYQMKINIDRAKYWMKNGATPSNRVKHLMKRYNKLKKVNKKIN